MKRLISSVLLLLSIAAFTSCNDESHRELNLDEILLGRVWSGDLGFSDPIGTLISLVHFEEASKGYDQRYDDKGPVGNPLDFEWHTSDRGTTVTLKYLPNKDEEFAPRELRNVYYDYLALSGDLYIGGQFNKRVTLILQLNAPKRQ